MKYFHHLRLHFRGAESGLTIQIQMQMTARQNLIYNNTIVGNSVYEEGSSGYIGGGGLLCSRGNIIVSNNIIWGNTQPSGSELAILNGTTSSVSYNILLQETGNDNVKLNPAFADSLFYLAVSSPAVDAGNPDAGFNDPVNSGTPVFPSLGNSKK